MLLSQLSQIWTPPRVRAGAALLCAAAASVFAAPSAHAQLPVVSAVFAQTGNTFNYNFSVFNNTPNILAIVNINLPQGATISNFSAPTGFQTTYDSGVGIVSFLADADPNTPQDFFAGTTVNGFLLSSQTNLNGVGFDALDDQGNFYAGTVSAVAAAAPEPSSLGLLAFAAPSAGIFIAYRRRKNTSASLKG